MAEVPTVRSRKQTQDFEGLLNNLQDWELSFKEKGKKLRSDAAGKGNLDHQGQPSRNIAGRDRVNGKATTEKISSSGNASTPGHYDYLKEYEALSRLSSGVPSQDSFVDANSEKELGNEFFKQKKFNDAIDCYSRSIALSPTAVAYANRAMAYIKIKRFQEAENDCTEALNLDDRYIKAYSRRSTARKELRRLKESMDDAEFALRLDPQNQEIKKQYAESKSLLEKEILEKASRAFTGSGEGVRQGKTEVDRNKNPQKLHSASISSDGRVATVQENSNRIREVAAGTYMETQENGMRRSDSDAEAGSETAKRKPKTGKPELRASVQELAAKAANLAKAEAAKNIVPPNSAYQFEVTWRGLSGDCDLQAHLLKVTPPAALPGIFKNALSAPMLIDIIKCIATFFVEEMSLGVEHLQNLTRIPRFDMIVMCLSSTDKADLSTIWGEVFSKGMTNHAETLSDLRLRYGIKQ